MFEKDSQLTIPKTPAQTTAFTSLVIGVFLNSPLIPAESLHGINESEIYSKYGEQFLSSLRNYSELNTLEQMQVLHLLQR